MISKENYKPFFKIFAVLTGVATIGFWIAGYETPAIISIILCMMCINGHANSK